MSFNGKEEPHNVSSNIFDACVNLSKVKVPSNYIGNTFCGKPVEKSLSPVGGDSSNNDPSNNDNHSNSSKDSKLSGGAIAGIVIGSVVTVAAIVGGALWFKHHSEQSSKSQVDSEKMVELQLQPSAEIQS